MASIVKEVRIERPADEVWDAVLDFGAVGTRLVPGFLTDSHLEGDDVRVVTFAHGPTVRERLVGVDHHGRRLAYAVVDSAFAHHNASVQVASSDGGCTFVWSCDVLPHEAGDRVDALMTAGIAVIKQTMEDEYDAARHAPAV